MEIMNIIFFGSSDFSAKVLSHLHRKEKVALAVTQHPKPAGRHYREHHTPVDTVARELGVPVFAPFSVNDNESVAHIRSYTPDMFVVVSYGQILSRELLSCAKILPLAIHPSLLPRYRGAAPINAALMHGETHTGVTFIRMNASMDAGEIMLQEQLRIGEEDTVVTLSERLITVSCVMLDAFFALQRENRIAFTPQDKKLVTVAPKLSKRIARVDWSLSAKEIHDMIRGLLPWPVAFTTLASQQIKLFESAVRSIATNELPGTILDLSPEGIAAATGNGILLVKRLQRQGKKVLSAEDFVHGGHVKLGDRFV